METYKKFLENIFKIIEKYNISQQNLQTHMNRELEKELYRLILETYEQLEKIRILSKIWD